MAKTAFVGKSHTEATTALTLESAQALLDAKNKRIGREQYALHGIYPSGVVGKFAYVLAKRARNDGNGYRATPTIFWADGNTLRPCNRTSHADKRARVKARAVKDGVWSA